jgi:Cupin-like domain
LVRAGTQGHLEYEYPGTFRRDRLADTRSIVFSSSVNLAAPDFNKHPLFRGLRPHHVLLRPGDVLFMPAYWHHEVRSTGDGASPPGNIAVNFWYKNLTEFHEEADMLRARSGGGGGSARTEL